MSILVTGSAGFIAFHLIEELLKDNSNFVVGIDNFYSGTKENVAFLKSCDEYGNFMFIEADIREFEKLDAIMKKYNINQVYHLAALASVQESIKNPLLSSEVNVKGTLNILELARLNKVKRVVFSSSAAVYGDEPSLPKDEHSVMKPISPYGCDKFICEQYMSLYSELYSVETVSLRYFNVYGPRQSSTSDYSGVISVFQNKFENDEIPSIYGNGEQKRDFIYVKDIVKISIVAMNTPNISGEVFCVGTSVKTSINDLIKILNKKYKKNLEAKYLNERAGDIKESVCDNTKVKKIFNIDNFINFEDAY